MHDGWIPRASVLGALALLLVHASGCLAYTWRESGREVVGAGPPERDTSALPAAAEIAASWRPEAADRGRVEVAVTVVETMRTLTRATERQRRHLTRRFTVEPVIKQLGVFTVAYSPILLLEALALSAGSGDRVEEATIPKGDWVGDPALDVVSRRAGTGVAVRFDTDDGGTHRATTDGSGRAVASIAPRSGHCFAEGIGGPASVVATASLARTRSVRIRTEAPAAETSCSVQELDVREAAREVSRRTRCVWLVSVRGPDDRPIQGATVYARGHVTRSAREAFRSVKPDVLREAIVAAFPEASEAPPIGIGLTDQKGEARIEFPCPAASGPVMLQAAHPDFGVGKATRVRHDQAEHRETLKFTVR